MVACCSINMRIFKISEFMLISLSIVWSSYGAPERSLLSEIAKIEESSESGDYYDQRQNGSENYRIHVDGVVFVVAPIEGLLLASGIPGIGDSNLFGIGEQEAGIENKPKPEEAFVNKPSQTTTIKPTEEKPADAKSSHSHGLRLMNLLSPFLRRVHQHQ